MEKRLLGFSFLVFAAFASGIPAADAGSVLVAQCLSGAPCDIAETITPWSDSLSKADLQSLGLGMDVTLLAEQTDTFEMQLGATMVTFSTPSGSVMESVPAFSGTGHATCSGICETDSVGLFVIPPDATSAVISGAFGNSVAATTAPLNLYLQTTTVPLPASAWLLLSGALGVLCMSRRKRAAV
jgi:hypothetical protein